MKKLKPVDYKILFELVKNSKISDRKLAKKIGVSQPTVTRRRAGLEKEELLDYTAIPNFEKLGFEIMAFTFGHWKHGTSPDEKPSEAKSFLSKYPNIIFVSTGRGCGMDRMFVSVHKDYTDYAELMSALKTEWGKFMSASDTFIVSLKGDNILRNLTFKYLKDYMKKVGIFQVS
ncbi:MAG: winged helix-turn-helix transcriptional regulator [Candidatus Bathyarchaeota archaeon]|nr:winged helix-turn-helix transcriptional regulator [Candidatus Bathyarchaeota archaeon]MDH5494381.1 winged helix-turn-helix transcriptional regulator [Candidatus Bathyarchaeota archaeon]